MSETVRWGREIEVTEEMGFACRMYRHRPRSLAELLLDARRWRGREFVVQGTKRLTFDAFEHAVAGAVARLAGEGIGPGDRVFLHGFNHIEWLVGFWGAQCLGAATVLGNAWWSEAEVEAALTLTEPRIVLSEGRHVSLPRKTPPVLSFAELAPERLGSGTQLPGRSATAEDETAIIMFSSGTTGAAKGVLMTHRGIIANIQNLLVLTGRLPHELSPDRPGTVSLLASPLFHLAGLQIQVNTLLTGGRLIFLTGRFDPLQALEIIEREKVRVWGGIPAMVARVVEHPEFGGFDTSSVSSVPLGGAVIPPELREKIKAVFPATAKRVGSLYGHTEAGGVLAAGSGAELDARPGSVGRALPVVELAIDAPNEDGVGDVLARTPTVTRGYLREKRALHDAKGWIRSGDLGRIDDEGYLYLVGRSKDIIIRGGENIACAHVERTLLTHPEVMEVAVVPLAHADLGEEVGACVVVRQPGAVTEAELTAYARDRLARFEVPSRWWLRSDPLPMSPSGKILKRPLADAWPAGPM